MGEGDAQGPPLAVRSAGGSAQGEGETPLHGLMEKGVIWLAVPSLPAERDVGSAPSLLPADAAPQVSRCPGWILGGAAGKGLAPTPAFLPTLPFVRVGKLRHRAMSPIARPSKLRLREGVSL